MTGRIFRFTIPVFCVVLANASARAEDWPCLRGPRHDGIHQETGWQKIVTSPKVLWKARVGDSFSSFACVGGRVYTCGTEDGQQAVMCLEADSGKRLWSRGFESAYRDGNGSGTRATPTVDDGRVYVVGARGTLVCLDAGTGKVRWQKKLGPKPRWGHSGSVLIEGDLAVVTAGSSDGALVAYDKLNGRRVWGAGSEQASYGTPYPFTLNGKRYIFGFFSKSFLIAEADGGRLVHTESWRTGYDVNSASPIYHDGYLYVSSNYGTGAKLFRLAAQRKGLRVNEVWKSKDLQNRFSSMVLHDGNLYGQCEGKFICADFKTGRVHWSVRSANWGNGFVADDHLVVYSARGKLYIAKATPSGFKPITKTEVQRGKCWTVPVLHSKRLYVRNLSEIVCLDMR